MMGSAHLRNGERCLPYLADLLMPSFPGTSSRLVSLHPPCLSTVAPKGLGCRRAANSLSPTVMCNATVGHLFHRSSKYPIP